MEEDIGPGASRQGQRPSGKALSAPMAGHHTPAALPQVVWQQEPGPWSLVSSSLQSHGLQHARFPLPSLSPGACSDSYPLSW